MGWARRSGDGSRSERSRLWKSGSGLAGRGAASQQSSRVPRRMEAARMARPAPCPPACAPSAPPPPEPRARDALISGPRGSRASPRPSHPGLKCARRAAPVRLPFEDPRSTLLAGVTMFAAASGNYICPGSLVWIPFLWRRARGQPRRPASGGRVATSAGPVTRGANRRRRQPAVAPPAPTAPLPRDRSLLTVRVLFVPGWAGVGDSSSDLFLFLFIRGIFNQYRKT